MRQYALKDSPDVWINVPTLDSELSELWAFIAEFMEDYSISNNVQFCNDCKKYIENELTMEDFYDKYDFPAGYKEKRDAGDFQFFFGSKEQAKESITYITLECFEEALDGLENKIESGNVLERNKPIIQYHQPNSYTAASGQYWEELPVITDWYGMNDDFWQRFLPGYDCRQDMSDEGYLSLYVNGEMDLEDTEDAVSAEYWGILEDMDVVKEKLRELRYKLTCSSLEYFYESVQNGEIQIRTI